MLFLIAASLIWAFSFGLINTTPIQSIPPAAVAFFRLVLATACFLPFLQVNSLAPHQVGRLLLIGSIQYGVMYIAFFEAFPLLKQGHLVALFTLTTPIYVGVLVRTPQSCPRWQILMLALISVVGALLILWQSVSWTQAWLGFAILQLSNICFAWGQVAYRDFRRAVPSPSDHSIYAWLFAGAAVTAGVYATLSGSHYPVTELSIQQMETIIYLGIIASGAGFYFWNRGAVTSNPATLAVMNNLKVPLAVFVALTLFSESASIPRLAIGGSMIIVAALLAEKLHSNEKLHRK